MTAAAAAARACIRLFVWNFRYFFSLSIIRCVDSIAIGLDSWHTWAWACHCLGRGSFFSFSFHRSLATEQIKNAKFTALFYVCEFSSRTLCRARIVCEVFLHSQFRVKRVQMYNNDFDNNRHSKGSLFIQWTCLHWNWIFMMGKLIIIKHVSTARLSRSLIWRWWMRFRFR